MTTGTKDYESLSVYDIFGIFLGCFLSLYCLFPHWKGVVKQCTTSLTLPCNGSKKKQKLLGPFPSMYILIFITHLSCTPYQLLLLKLWI